MIVCLEYSGRDTGSRHSGLSIAAISTRQRRFTTTTNRFPDKVGQQYQIDRPGFEQAKDY